MIERRSNSPNKSVKPTGNPRRLLESQATERLSFQLGIDKLKD
jgi:hypothetical protein